VIGLTAGSAAARPAAVDTSAKPKPKASSVPQIVFPVVGAVDYRDDFGEPRVGHSHQGNDLMAPRRSPAVATEDGRIKFWTTSSLAGCMLYLYGASGTTYLYIHLNNDLTKRNDNRGKCVPGVAYWPGIKDGAKVKAGQPIAFVGDSGDADGTPHLHFELHPNDGAAVSPFPYLQSALRMLFVAPTKSTVTLSMSGAVLGVEPGALKVRVDTLRVLPGSTVTTNLSRPLIVTVPPDALVQRLLPTGLIGGNVTLTEAKKGQTVTVLTQPVAASLDVQLGRDGVLSAAQIVLGR
jgi:hypothetical protein